MPTDALGEIRKESRESQLRKLLAAFVNSTKFRDANSVPGLRSETMRDYRRRPPPMRGDDRYEPRLELAELLMESKFCER
jgi:hypothetical protein